MRAKKRIAPTIITISSQSISDMICWSGVFAVEEFIQVDWDVQLDGVDLETGGETEPIG